MWSWPDSATYAHRNAVGAVEACDDAGLARGPIDRTRPRRGMTISWTRSWLSCASRTWGSATQLVPRRDFASKAAFSSVPLSNTISRVGVRPGGVEVPPTRAGDGPWQVVVLAGHRTGTWPNMRLRDRILRADLLADVGAGRTVIGDDGREGTHRLCGRTKPCWTTVPPGRRRARRRCYVRAGPCARSAPSVFFDAIGAPGGHARR